MPKSCFSAFFLHLAASGALLAQTAPDAGRLIEQNRAPSPAPQAARPVLPERAQAAPIAQDASPVQITGFQFEGQRLFTQAQLTEHLLQALQQSSLPATLRFGQLRQAVASLSTLYADQGYFLARAVLPQQSIEAQQGLVRIVLLEGRLDQVRQNADAAHQALALNALAAQNIQIGQALHQGATERALLLLSQRLGETASVSLAPGASQGSTDLSLQLPRAAPVWLTELSTDNFGNRFTGIARLQAQTSRSHLASLGDKLSLRAQASAGMRYASLGYSLPIGHDGWTLSANASALHYALCCQFSALQAQGSAQTLSLGASYPLILRSTHRLDFDSSITQRHSRDETLAGRSADKQARPLLLGLTYNDSRALDGKLLQSARLGYSQTRLDQRILPNPNVPERLRKLRFEYSAVAHLSARQQWLARLNAQYAFNNLDSSEKFSLGGAQGVRGWPVGEAAGDSGQVLSLEWRRSLSSSDAASAWSTSAFYDWGHIKQHREQWVNSLPPGQSNDYSLKSLGLGLAYSAKSPKTSWSAQLQWAHALGQNPAASAAGLNSDGRASRNHFWLQSSLSF